MPSIKTYLSLFRKKVCTLPDGPSQSPDLNPIENIWVILKKNVSRQNASKKEKLWYKLWMNGWLMPTCGLCNYPFENNGYCGHDEANKVIDVLQVHLDNFVNTFFESRIQLWPFPSS